MTHAYTKPQKVDRFKSYGGNKRTDWPRDGQRNVQSLLTVLPSRLTQSLISNAVVSYAIVSCNYYMQHAAVIAGSAAIIARKFF